MCEDMGRNQCVPMCIRKGKYCVLSLFSLLSIILCILLFPPTLFNFFAYVPPHSSLLSSPFSLQHPHVPLILFNRFIHVPPILDTRCDSLRHPLRPPPPPPRPPPSRTARLRWPSEVPLHVRQGKRCSHQLREEEGRKKKRLIREYKLWGMGYAASVSVKVSGFRM